MSEDNRITGTDGFFTDDPADEMDDLSSEDFFAEDLQNTDRLNDSSPDTDPQSVSSAFADPAGTGTAAESQNGVQPGNTGSTSEDTESPEKAESAPVDPEEKKRQKQEKRQRSRQKRARQKETLEKDLKKGVDEVNRVKKEWIADDRELKETSRKNLHLIFGLLGVVLAAALVVFLLSDRFYNAVNGRSSYVLEDMGVSASYIEGNTTLVMHDGMLLRCSQDGLMALNDKGSVEYDIPFTMSAPYVVSAGDYVSVADRLGMSVIVVKDGQTQASITTESTIILNTVNEVGESCVVLSADSGNLVNLYSSSGETLMTRRTYATTDGLPMALALSSDGSRMATVYVNYTGSSLTSIITIFDLTETGSALVDRIIGSVSFTDMVISDIRFVGDDLFYAGTNSMGELSTDSSVDTIWETTLAYELKTLAFGEDFYVVQYGSGLAGTVNAAEYNIVVYSFNGEVLYETYVDSSSYVDAWGDTVIYADGRVYYGISSSGKPKWTLNTGDTYGTLVAFDNDKTVAVTQNGEIKFFKVSLRSVDSEYDN